VRAENLSKVFGRGGRQALEQRRTGGSKTEVEASTGATIGVFDASFEVRRGEVFVIIGLSGSGKSTLLRLLNRLVEPTSGEVYLDDKRISGLSAKQLRQLRRQKIGMVFQHFGLLPNRTVMGNVTYGLEVEGVPRDERERAGSDALVRVGLEGQADKQIRELSGGMQQRVGLARALATSQEILLMDEPFSALDPIIRQDMQELFLNLQGEMQRTVVFVTHDLDEALRLGHRVAIMNSGEIVQIGTPDEILTNPADEYVEKFIAGVDYAKVRRAGDIMAAPDEVAFVDDTPHDALRRMEQAGLSTVCVLDHTHCVVGLVDVESLRGHAEEGGGAVRDAMMPVRHVAPDTPLREIIPSFVDSGLPVAVTDEARHLHGVIARSALIGGLCTESLAGKAAEEGGARIR
jgi:glycine betaine/proline transport system ATP-binding protein